MAGPSGSRASVTYGFPIYCAAWVPPIPFPAADAGDGAGSGDGSPDSQQPSTVPEIFKRGLVAVGGGGGEGRSGVPNVLAVAAVDAASLAEKPVIRLGTEGDLPYRMAMHPKGDGVVCAFPKGCRLFEWELSKGKDSDDVTLKPSERVLAPLHEAGQQLALRFNDDGSILASGSEDGELRVCKWPAMKVVFEESIDNSAVKDLDFSPDGKYVVSLRDSGPCKVWDLTSASVAANLPKEAGERFGYCKFSRHSSQQALFVTAMQGDYALIVTWNTDSWRRVNSKKITREPISAFTVSPDGDLLAIGTIEGTIMILGSRDMQVRVKLTKVHLGIITTLGFSQDSRVLFSSSFDSTARITEVEAKRNTGFSMWPVILIVLLAIFLYYFQSRSA